MPHIPPKIDWKDSAVTGHLAKSSRFERDKFTGYLFAPFVDALTDDRRHIEMRGCRYTAPPLTSTGSVVYRTLRGYCNKFCKCTKGRRFHNHVGAFRRKADYTYEPAIGRPFVLFHPIPTCIVSILRMYCATRPMRWRRLWLRAGRFPIFDAHLHMTLARAAASARTSRPGPWLLQFPLPADHLPLCLRHIG